MKQANKVITIKDHHYVDKLLKSQATFYWPAIPSFLTFTYWQFRDYRTPNWDESPFLEGGSAIKHGFELGIIKGLEQIFVAGDSLGRTPLLKVICAIFVGHGSYSNLSFQIMLSILWLLWLVACIWFFKSVLRGYGITAALIFVGFSPLLHSSGHLIIPDLIMVTLTTGSLGFVIRGMSDKPVRNAMGAILLASLAFLSKPSSIIFFSTSILSLALFCFFQEPKSKRSQQIKYLLRIWISTFLIELVYIIPHLQELVGYALLQNSFPKSAYILASKNAGNPLGFVEFSWTLINLSGIAAYLIYLFLFSILISGKHKIYRNLPKKPLFIGIGVFLTLTPFSFSKLWEYRYVEFSIVGLGVIVGAFLINFEPKKKFGTNLFFLTAVVFASIPFTVDLNPQNWNQTFQEIFYGTPIKGRTTNIIIGAMNNGVNPLVKENSAKNFIELYSSYVRKPHVNIGLIMSHPELNPISLRLQEDFLNSSSSNFSNIRLNVIDKDKRIVKVKDDELRRDLNKLDYIIIPNFELIPANYPDLVSWQNHNIFLTNSLKTYIFEKYALESLFSFKASKPFAVAHNEKEKFTFYKIDRKKVRSEITTP